MKSDIPSICSLIDIAMGRQPADLVVRKGTWACLQSGKLVLETDIAVKDGRSRRRAGGSKKWPGWSS